MTINVNVQVPHNPTAPGVGRLTENGCDKLSAFNIAHQFDGTEKRPKRLDEFANDLQSCTDYLGKHPDQYDKYAAVLQGGWL